MKLKKEFVSADTKQFTASHLKTNLKDTGLDDEHIKLYFKKFFG